MIVFHKEEKFLQLCQLDTVNTLFQLFAQLKLMPTSYHVCCFSQFVLANNLTHLASEFSKS